MVDNRGSRFPAKAGQDWTNSRFGWTVPLIGDVARCLQGVDFGIWGKRRTKYS